MRLEREGCGCADGGSWDDESATRPSTTAFICEVTGYPGLKLLLKSHSLIRRVL